MSAKAEVPSLLTAGGKIEAQFVSPSTLGRYLSESHQGMMAGFYRPIFGALRKLPEEEQSQLLVGFFTERLADFPNGERLGKYLAKINNIAWFQPKKEPSPDHLQKLINQLSSRLHLPALPVGIIHQDWSEADTAAKSIKPWGESLTKERLDIAWGRAYPMGIREERRAAMHLAMIMVNEIPPLSKTEQPYLPRTVAWGTMSNVIRSAGWIIVEDLMRKGDYPKGNPYEPLIEIYKLGCQPIGERQCKFVIFVPEIQKST